MLSRHGSATIRPPGARRTRKKSEARAIAFVSMLALFAGVAPASASATTVTRSSPRAGAAVVTRAASAEQLVCDGKWHTIPSVDPLSDYGDDDTLVAASTVNAMDAWAVGYSTDFDRRPGGFRTLSEHWDGTKWSVVPMPNSTAAPWNELFGVAAVSSNDVWAVGSVGTGEGPGGYRSLIEHWDGKSWTIQNDTMPLSYLTSVSAKSANDVWVAGSTNYPGTGLVVHWDGTHWTRMLIPGSGPMVFRGIDELSPTDIWAVGQQPIPGSSSGDTTVAFHYDGKKWTPFATPNPLGKYDLDQNWLTSVQAISSNDVWATGVARDPDYIIPDHPFSAHWDGKRWSYIGTPNPTNGTGEADLWGTATIPAQGGDSQGSGSQDLWAIGRTGMWPNLSTFSTHWDGKTWTQVPSTTPGELNATASDHNGGLWAFGDQQYPYGDGTFRNGTLIQHLCPSQDRNAQGSAATSASTTTAAPLTSSPMSATPVAPALARKAAASAAAAVPAGSAMSATTAIRSVAKPAIPAAQAMTHTSALTTRSTAAGQARHLCAKPEKTGYASCFAMIQSSPTQRLGLGASTTATAVNGFGPADLQSAYNLPSGTAGAGQTVGIVDAFDDPNAESDLAAYRAKYGLPACTVASGCLRKADQRGGTTYPNPDPGWSGEISLDLDMVSAACPNCRILLVEADDNSLPNLGAAQNEAVALGAKFVSDSFGGPEDPAETTWDNQYWNHPGVAMTASAGDFGYGVEYPAASANVTSVGGTSLTKDGSSRGWSESAWSGTGSGCSAYIAKPNWQTDAGCPNRTVADVSAVADPQTGLAVYDTYSAPGWLLVGGTSASSPLVAASYALAGTPPASSQPNSFPYAANSAFNDVITGSNGSCSPAPAYLCNAGPGYDGPTGLGTPNGVTGFAPTGPHGDLVGTVTDQASHTPLMNAKITAGNLVAYTDKTGHYDLFAPAGSYTVTADQYGYQSQSTAGVTVVQNLSTTTDFALTVLPTYTVSGAVTDGSGHGWPLYAMITIDGTPGGPIWTDPVTGHYSVKLPAGSTYTMHVSASYPGYQSRTVQVTPNMDTISNVSVPVDQNLCSAPGYQFEYSGTTQTFDNAQAPAGWTTSSSGAGGTGWGFSNAGNVGNTTSGTGNFAIVNSDNDGFGKTQDASLSSPTMDLSNETTPIVQFAQDYTAGLFDTANVDVSIDGGAHWSTAYTQDVNSATGVTTAVPIPQAAGQKHVRVRFHYQTASWSWWWEVDNVFVGNRSCDPSITGGLVVGTVTDAATHAPLNAATVTSTTDAQESATTASSDDPAIPGGFYWMFVTGNGPRNLTATAAGYQPLTLTAQLAANATTRLDFALSSAAPATAASPSAAKSSARP